MNAVIIYDTFDFGAQANAMLKRATRWKDETTLWDVRLWRADLLKMPLAAETALMEAVEAHLIMLAVRHVQSLLPWLMDWLERWALHRLIPEAALALWVGGSAENRLSQTTREFSQFAENHGLSLIFDDNATVEGKSSMFKNDVRKHEVSPPLTFQNLLQQPVRDDHQYGGHWGLKD